MSRKSIGMIGLGVMGENLALNIERNGFSVAGYDLDAGKRAAFTKRTAGKNATAAESMVEFLDVLEIPRRILMMVPGGEGR